MNDNAVRCQNASVTEPKREVVPKCYREHLPFLIESKYYDKKDILDYFSISREMGIKLGRLALYVSLKVSKDCTNADNISLSNLIEKLNTDVTKLTSFDNVELCKNSDEFLLSLASDNYFKDLNLEVENLIKIRYGKLLQDS